MSPEVVLLDVDGTLVDSNDAHAESWVEALSERGIDVELADVRRLIGMGSDKLLPKLTGFPLEDERHEALAKLASHIFRDRHLPKLQAFPKVRELLEAFHSNGLMRVVASSAKKEESQALLEHVGIADLIDEITTSDSLKSKPDGDIVIAALKRAKLPAEKAMMLGDTPYDISSAKAANVRCVALRSGGWKDEDLKDAIAIYDDAATLLRKLDRSPFVRAG